MDSPFHTRDTWKWTLIWLMYLWVARISSVPACCWCQKHYSAGTPVLLGPVHDKGHERLQPAVRHHLPTEICTAVIMVPGIMLCGSSHHHHQISWEEPYYHPTQWAGYIQSEDTLTNLSCIIRPTARSTSNHWPGPEPRFDQLQTSVNWTSRSFILQLVDAHSDRQPQDCTMWGSTCWYNVTGRCSCQR